MLNIQKDKERILVSQILVNLT